MSPRRSPDEALAEAFGAIAAHARGGAFSDTFSAKTVGPVVFVGDDALQALDPVLLAGRGPEVFRSTLLTFTLGELSTLARDHDLVAGPELRGLTPPQAVELLWSRAHQRVRTIRG